MITFLLEALVGVGSHFVDGLDELLEDLGDPGELVAGQLDDLDTLRLQGQPVQGLLDVVILCSASSEPRM